MKIGRNEPCFCGSGKKFKKCCGKASPAQPKPDHDISASLETAWSLCLAGRFNQAENIYKDILEVEPENTVALHYLGVIAYQRGNSDSALKLFEKAIAINPLEPSIHNDLGNLLYKTKRLTEAADSYKKALTLNPGFAQAHYNLGVALKDQEQAYDAIGSFKKALEINPDYVNAQNNLATSLMSIGLTEEAIPWFQKALENEPNDNMRHDNLLLAMNYSSRCAPQVIYEEHLRYAKMHAEPLMQYIAPHENTREPLRKLKIGYVSPDFRSHSVAYFIEPVLEHHDHEQFEIFAYYAEPNSDAITQRLKQYCDHWRDIANVNDKDAAELIRNDKIDILIDLSGHSRNNRLLIFAYKPSPIQITWLGYPNTSGLATIDYRITDRFADPDGETDRFYTEKLLRLPESFSCYRAPKDAPDIAETPALTNGYITFGSFNNLAKITPEVIQLWSKVITKVPGSRLVLKCVGLLDNEATQKEIIRIFAKNGLPRERLTLLGRSASHNEHLQQYHKIDIALDPFPYNGTTTTCDALWMGVPVITLTGNSHASRVGVSQMNNIGHMELIAKDKNDYVAISERLSSDFNYLQDIRSNMRNKMQASTLMDDKRFTDNLESAYRDVWEEWCQE